MSWLISFAKSSLGAKVVMALTGIILVGFAFGHMIGNMQVFMGPEPINKYAHFLQNLGGALWIIRLVMLTAVVLHIVSGLRLALLNRAARPGGYAVTNHQRATLSSKLMPWSGLIAGAFVVYHLLHFTTGDAHSQFYGLLDDQGRHDVYKMFVLSFRQPVVAISYIIAMLLLGLHLKHGIASMFQSLGLTSPRYAPLINKVGPVVAIMWMLGNISFPLTILTGAVGGDVPDLSEMTQRAPTHSTQMAEK